MRKSKQKGAKRGVTKRKRRAKPAEISIRRSSGRKEKFDRERLASTTSRSGVPFLMARDIAKKVTRKVRTESRGKKKKLVTAGRIRKIVGNELHGRNPAIASAYRGDKLGKSSFTEQKTKLRKPPVGTADTEQHGAYRADRDSVMHDKSKRLTSSR